MDEFKYCAEFMLKVSSRPGSELGGEATFLFSDEVYKFSTLYELIFLVEDKLGGNCPHLQQNFRTWSRATPNPCLPPPKRELRAIRENHQTFHISIQFAENYTWQGRLQWLEGRKSLHFRSFLELVILLDEARRSAVSKVSVSSGN